MMTAEENAHAQKAASKQSDPTLRARLVEAGILIETGENGLYGRSEVFEDVIERLNKVITLLGADQRAEVLRFPPAMRRHDFEDSEYLKSFPDLAGTIHAFQGNDRGHHRLLEALDKTLAVGDAERSDEWMDQQKADAPRAHAGRLLSGLSADRAARPARRGRRDRRRVRLLLPS